MSVLPILTWPDPRLSQRCEPVVHAPGLAGVIADLFETMYAAQGRGLAAPQIGILQQFFVASQQISSVRPASACKAMIWRVKNNSGNLMGSKPPAPNMSLIICRVWSPLTVLIRQTGCSLRRAIAR